MLPPYPQMSDEQKAEMWEEIAYEFSKPESLRRPKVQIYGEYQLPDTTFYWHMRKPEFKRRVVEIALNEAKNWVPELMDVLREKAVDDKSEKYIEMALKYVADVAERLDLTTKGKELGRLTKEQEEALDNLLANEQSKSGQSNTGNQGGADLLM